MNEEICCITNNGKTAEDEWKNDDSDFLLASYNVYKKIWTILFTYLLVNLSKQRYINSVKSYKYLNNFLS